VDEETKPQKKKEKNTGMAVIAYLVFFLPLLTEAKNDPYVKFHVKQGLVLLILWIIISAVSGIIPFIGPLVIGPIGGLVSLILIIIGIMNALNGEQKPLPLIGQFGEKLKF